MGNYTDGLYGKYRVTKRDGTPTDGDADYFVMRLDTDEHARVAALAYADSVEKENPFLANDLRAVVVFWRKGTINLKRWCSLPRR